MNKDIIMREVNSMRFFWALFWTFLLAAMLTYVVGSMSGMAFDLTTAGILTVVAVVVIYIISAVLPDDPKSDHAAH
jgi:small-conductance mechanosensitive channel